MSATKIGALATAIAAAVEDAGITSMGNALKVYDYEPRDLDAQPAVTVTGPASIRRVEPDEAESQLGSFDWRMTFVLRIYVPQDDPQTSEYQMRAVLGQVIAAIDADRSLGGEADIDAVLSNGEIEPVQFEGSDRQFLLFTGDLDVWALVS